jgi:phage recombination protein Bet
MSNIIKIEKDLDLNNPKIQKVIYDMMAPQNTTPEEFFVFMSICKTSGLNPLKKEAWLIKTYSEGRQKVQVTCGINGYRKIANSHPMYDGMEIDTQYDEQMNPIKSTCLIYRKDRSKPFPGTAIFKEVAQKTKTGEYTKMWKDRPSQMLEKCAEIFAIRRAFEAECNGLYCEEEMPEAYSLKVVEATKDVLTETNEDEEKMFEKFYNIASVAESKKQKIIEYLLEHNAEDISNQTIWKSNHRLIKLDKYEMAEETLAKDRLEDVYKNL